MVVRTVLGPQKFNPNSWEFSTLIADAREEIKHTIWNLTAASLE